MNVRGRTAVITGAASGIGRGIAVALAKRGCNLALADLNEAGLAETAELAKGIEISRHRLDVANREAVAALPDAVMGEHDRVDILVNNAGVARSDVKAEDTSDEHWRLHMEVNLDGVFWCCRAFGRHMLAQGKGAIVNIG